MTEADRAHWVTVAEAAALLGKSERTVWRWVDKGKLPIDRSETPHLVDVSDEDIDVNVDTSDTSQTERGSLIDRLQTENQELRAANQRLELELRHAEDTIARQERELNRLWSTHAAAMRGLPAPKEQRSWIERIFPWIGRDETE
jgi:predicted DNA-binding transcriptional regulator AlpA